MEIDINKPTNKPPTKNATNMFKVKEPIYTNNRTVVRMDTEQVNNV